MEEDFSNKKPSLHSSGWTSHSESKIAHLKSKKLVNLFIPMSDIRLVNASLKSLIGLDAQKISSSDSEKIINQNTVSVLTEAVGYDWYSKILLDLDDEIDTQEEMPFIICPFNRYSPEKHLFRSPWSSQYYPEENKGDDFRELFGEAYQELSGMERRANELFYNYGEMYHGGRKGLVTSFYIIDYERDQLIECIFLLKKKTESSIWSTSHYFKIIFKDKEKIYFNCISAVYSKTTLSGCEISHKNDSKVEQSVKEGKNDTKLIVAKMGEILEEVEKQFFNDFKEITLPKSFLLLQSNRINKQKEDNVLKPVNQNQTISSDFNRKVQNVVKEYLETKVVAPESLDKNDLLRKKFEE